MRSIARAASPLIGMAIYHFSWDLADFRLAPPMLPFSPPMRLFSHGVASAFLALVGLSLALAHRDGMNWPAFWRRLALIAGAAALVTGASFVFSPGQPILFGILHCIAVASLLAAPFVEAPAWASLAAGAAVIVAPAFVHSRLFDPPALLWLGLGEALPDTLDWRPLLPWGRRRPDRPRPRAPARRHNAAHIARALARGRRLRRGRSPSLDATAWRSTSSISRS